MSLIEDQMREANALRAEANRQADAQHMAEMAQKTVADALVPKNAVQEAWDKRHAWWAQLKVLAETQQKK